MSSAPSTIISDALTIDACKHNKNDSRSKIFKFILKSLGTGTVARMAARVKAEGLGDDSSEAWADTQYDDVTVSHTTLGEVFEATFDLDASGFDLDDAVALQVGRDGAHANDTLDQPVQIFCVKGVAI